MRTKRVLTSRISCGTVGRDERETGRWRQTWCGRGRFCPKGPEPARPAPLPGRRVPRRLSTSPRRGEVGPPLPAGRGRETRRLPRPGRGGGTRRRSAGRTSAVHGANQATRTSRQLRQLWNNVARIESAGKARRAARRSRQVKPIASAAARPYTGRLPSCGAVAQMGERSNRTAEVRGSIPLCSTTGPPNRYALASRLWLPAVITASPGCRPVMAMSGSSASR